MRTIGMSTADKCLYHYLASYSWKQAEIFLSASRNCTCRHSTVCSLLRYCCCSFLIWVTTRSTILSLCLLTHALRLTSEKSNSSIYQEGNNVPLVSGSHWRRQHSAVGFLHAHHQAREPTSVPSPPWSAAVWSDHSAGWTLPSSRHTGACTPPPLSLSPVEAPVHAQSWWVSGGWWHTAVPLPRWRQAGGLDASWGGG